MRIFALYIVSILTTGYGWPERVLKVEKITIYTSGGFGISKYEAKLIEHGHKKYAQYDAAPYVHFIEKGKRTPKGIVMGYKPFILILKGHGHPEPADGFIEQDIEGVPGMVTKRSRYSSFDSRYQTDFNALINPYISANPELVIADYRHDKSEAAESGAA